MARYLVGDIQGCFDELQILLSKVGFTPSKDELWSVGDIVARGKKSLQTVEYLHNLEGSCKLVLGNHDLNLLAIRYQIRTANPKDNLSELLASPKLNQYCDWLRQQPLVIHLPKEHSYISHAGIPPNWQANQITHFNATVQSYLRGCSPELLLKAMYNNQLNRLAPNQHKLDEAVYAINSFTRMRYLQPDLSLDFACKLPTDQAPAHLTPWFNVPNPNVDAKIYFGHWASIEGHTNSARHIGLDTGCVWGGELTMLNLDSGELISHSSNIEASKCTPRY